jgi:hypothetical protein
LQRPTPIPDAPAFQQSGSARQPVAGSGQSHLAFLDESEQGSAILREMIGGFSSGAKAAFGVSLIPAQQRHVSHPGRFDPKFSLAVVFCA